MIDSLVHFNQLQRAGYGRTSRTLKMLCTRYDVPVLALNKRQYALRRPDYELLLARATGKETV